MMDIENYWNKALRNTEIIRSRVQPLFSFQDTAVPYVLLSESSINEGDTVIRRGEVVVQKPSLIVPAHNPQFYGFEFEEDKGVSENTLVNFLLVRGVTIPSLRYDNKTVSLEVLEGALSKAVKEHNEILQQAEDVTTGLIIAPEDCWQFSLLIFVCTQITRNAEQDFKKLMDDFRKKFGQS
jgi:hypothetical protein